MKILMVITDGFEDIEAIGTLAILRRANLDVTVAAIDNTKALGRYNVDVHSLVNLSTIEYKDYDALIIPGGPEYQKEEKDQRFLDMVSYFVKNNKLVAAICAAPTILGHLGLLKGKKYTCFTSMNEDFGGTYIDDYAIKDGNLITGRSAASVLPFSFMIIEAVKGKQLADAVKKSIYYYE